MSDRRPPPPSRDAVADRDYDYDYPRDRGDRDFRGPPPPPPADRFDPRDGRDRFDVGYRERDRDYADYRSGGPPPPHPSSYDYRRELPRSPGYDARRGPPPPLRDPYDSFHGPPGAGGGAGRVRSPEPFEGRGKRRRSHSPPPRRGGPDYYEPHPRDYPPRDGYRAPPPPPPTSSYPPRGGDPYAPGPPVTGRALPPPVPSSHHRPLPPSRGVGAPPGGDPYAMPPPPGPPGPPGAGYGYGPAYDQPFHRSEELEAPHRLPYRVTYRYFSDWFTQTSPSSLASSASALETAWKKYLAESLRRELRPGFEALKEMKWFVERYGVGEEHEGQRNERQEMARLGRRHEWVKLAREGEWEGLTSDFDEGALSESKPERDGDVSMSSAATPAANDATVSNDEEGKAAADGDKGKDDGASEKPQNENDAEEKKQQQKKKQGSPPIGDGLMTLSPETVLIPSRPNRIIVDNVLPNVSYADLKAVFAPLEGFQRLSLGDGQPFMNWVRTAWVTFGTEEEATKAVEALGTETVIGEYRLSVRRQEHPVEAKIRAAPSYMSNPDRLAKDLETAKGIVEYLERAMAPSAVSASTNGEGDEAMVVDKEGSDLGSQVIEEWRQGWQKEVEARKEKGDDSTKLEAETTRKTLDAYLHYLRYAFHVCYYCATRCESAEHLESVCARHVRRNEMASPADMPFVTGLDEKLPLLGDPEKLDLRDFGAELREEVLFGICQPHIKNEEEGKFRCKECNKLFSARKFVEKHIVTKHSEFIGDTLDQVAFFNNYILDPAHHPIADFQRMNFLPSLLNPPPPPSSSLSGGGGVPLADRIGARRAGPTNGSDKRGGGGGGRRDGAAMANGGSKLAPPQGAVLDPRSARVPSSYADLDGAPSGGADVIALPY